MNIKTRLTLINDNYYEYLKSNSNWIKELSRSSSNINKFIDFIRDKYSLKLSDKVENIISKMEVLSSVLSTLK